MEKLPDIIAKKESLIKKGTDNSASNKDLGEPVNKVLPLALQPRRIAGGLAHKIKHNGQLSELAIIEEDDAPPSREL